MFADCAHVLSYDYRGRRSLDTEVKLLQKAQGHRNIVTIIGRCIDEDFYSLVMEYVEGCDLHKLTVYIRSPQIQLWQSRIDVTSQVAQGLRHLHSLDPPIIHNDLKPRNILVSRGQTKFICKVSAQLLVPYMVKCRLDRV